jgi:hypothetical protein
MHVLTKCPRHARLAEAPHGPVAVWSLDPNTDNLSWSRDVYNLRSPRNAAITSPLSSYNRSSRKSSLSIQHFDLPRHPRPPLLLRLWSGLCLRTDLPKWTWAPALLVPPKEKHRSKWLLATVGSTGTTLFTVTWALHWRGNGLAPRACPHESDQIRDVPRQSVSRIQVGS